LIPILGLVNKVVPKELLSQATNELAEKILQNSTEIIKLGKQAYYRQMAEISLKQAYAIAQPVMVSNLEHRHAKEGISAFLEKRKPSWDI